MRERFDDSARTTRGYREHYWRSWRKWVWSEFGVVFFAGYSLFALVGGWGGLRKTKQGGSVTSTLQGRSTMVLRQFAAVLPPILMAVLLLCCEQLAISVDPLLLKMADR